MKNTIDYIKLLDFFRELDEKKLDVLRKISKVAKYKKSYILYYEKDVKQKIFFLVDGLVKTYKVDRCDNEIFLSYIYNDNIISDIASLDDDSLQCYSNAEFIEDSVVLEVDYKLFKKNFIDKNILTRRFIKEVILKNNQLYSIIDKELMFDAVARVSYMLYNDLSTFNRLQRQEIACMLHIQPATLSRVLKKLNHQKIIEVDNTKVIVVKDNELKNIFI